MSFTNKVVVATGGVKGIGKCIVDEFKSRGVKVCIIDILNNDYFIGDISDRDCQEFCVFSLAHHILL